MVATVLEAAQRAPADRPVAITEVGAGTGGTAIAVMSALTAAGRDFRYCFTDLAPSLVVAARRALQPRFPQASFQVLDLEQPLAPDAEGDADIVIATNVLHATADIAVTAATCRGLLRAGGILVLNEAVRRRDFATLVFGLTDGWWRFRDADRRLPHSPLLDVAGWRRVLAEVGFGTVALVPGTGEEAAQAVLVATAAGHVLSEPVAPAEVAVAADGEAALEVARDAVRRALAEALRVPVDGIDKSAGFAAQGVNSIIGVDLVERLGRRLGVSVRVSALFDHPSPLALAAHLSAEHAAHLAGPAAAAPVAPASPARDAEGAAVPIAVVGMAGQWPGAANLGVFWRNLRDGASSIGLPPAGRWPGDTAGLPADGAWRRGGFLDAVDCFDPLFFEMSGVEADHTDPQARLFLATAWHALEDAGYGPAWLDGRRCGVFVGVAAGDYPSGAAPGAAPPPHAFMGNAQSVLAGRLAYLLNLRGPALAVDTACSSSLVALHLACRAIADGDCDVALAGGVFVTSTPSFHYLAATLGMTSPSGETRAFDDAANGFVPAEGVGVVVLRRLDAALADGDRILGVIRATGTNSDGRTHGMTAPSSRAQAELIAEVLARGAVPATALDYVEAHGTGTKLGDPIEVEALNRVLTAAGAADGACRIGSVKTNIGHTGPAAGMAGLQKVLLALGNEALPASLNFAVPNRHIDFAAQPVAVCDRLMAWPRRAGRPRRAGVSAFGLSGTNAHVLVEEAPALPPRAALPAGPFLFVLSGRTEAALACRAAALAAWLDGAGSDVPLADIAFTLAVGRRHMAHRRALLAADREALRRALMAPDPGAGPAAAGDVAAAIAAARSALRGGAGDAGALLVVAGAYAAGTEIDWLSLYAGAGLQRVGLPGYPFAQERHWVPLPDAAPVPVAASIRLHVPFWQSLPTQAGRLPAELMLFDGDADLADLLAAHVRVTRRPFDALDRVGDIPADRPVLVLRPDVAAAWTNVPARLLSFARGLLARARPVRVVLVLRGEGVGVEALAATAALDVALSPALGWTVLRLPALATPAEMAEAVLSEAAASGSGGDVRWDRGQRAMRCLRPAEMPASGGTLPAGAVCWIVGGTGAIGRTLAAHLTGRHGARVVLSGRRSSGDGLYPAAEMLPVDVTDAAAVARAAAAIRARHGRLDAVFHLAGTMRRAPLSVAADADIEAVLATKMAGAVNFDVSTAADRLSAFVLFSSLAAEVGDFGQGDYAVANRFLAGFAALRAASVARGERHGRSVSLGWPLWHSGGMAGSGEAVELALSASGLGALSDAEGLAALDALMGMDGHCVIVPAGGDNPFATAQGAASRPGTAAISSDALRRAVRDALAAELRIAAAEIADDAPFGTLGLDSLHIRAFADAVTARFGVAVGPTDLFRANTVAALAAHLARLGAGLDLALPAPARPGAAISDEAPVARAPRTRRDGAGVPEPIAIIGMAGRFPGAPDIGGVLGGAACRARSCHRDSGGPLGLAGAQRGARVGAGCLGAALGWLPRRGRSLRRGVLRPLAARGGVPRSADAAAAGNRLARAGERRGGARHAGRGLGRGFRRQPAQRLCRTDRRCRRGGGAGGARQHPHDAGQPGQLSARPARPVRGDRHGLFVVAGGGAPGRAQPAGRRLRDGVGGWHPGGRASTGQRSYGTGAVRVARHRRSCFLPCLAPAPGREPVHAG